ncbi:MAG: Hpt domain-containing protein [Salibacteraceae bacterium]
MAHLDLSYILDNVSSDRSFITQLLNVFLVSLEEDIPPLEQAIEAEDHEQVRKTAHKVKSSFRSLGMKEMTIYLQTLEDMGKDKKPMATIGEKFTGFISMLPDVKAEVKTSLDEYA